MERSMSIRLWARLLWSRLLWSWLLRSRWPRFRSPRIDGRGRRRGRGRGRGSSGCGAFEDADDDGVDGAVGRVTVGIKRASKLVRIDNILPFLWLWLDSELRIQDLMRKSTS